MVVVHMAQVNNQSPEFIYYICLIFVFIGTFAGIDGSRQPTNLELTLAEHQGSTFTQTATALKLGREALAASQTN